MSKIGHLHFILIAMLAGTLVQAQVYTPRFDVQGHRGARGAMPENTIPAFMYAIDAGVTTIEMDVAITKDGQVVVSHEGWMSAAITLDSAGKPIKEKDERKHNIYKLTYKDIAKYDVGSKVNERFPDQQKMKVSKPLLKDVIMTVEDYIKGHALYEVDYNIEIKTEPSMDGKFHPKPQEFSDIVFNLIDQYLSWDRIVIQSFDFRVLKYWHEKHPEVRLAALVENLNTIDENLKLLGFTPSIYSPEYHLLSKDEIKQCHSKRMRVIPWTVNETKEMEELKSWGVDGLITDYPDMAKQLGYTLKTSKGKK
ncbi:MAG TPA: glycerophosphodiester phosphodiesterase family protein [Cyclobacteriaceae bacterium]|nr:glycerophosphodiester phosphodiesterase family protein [Cyclobacteriaceae bacterium]